MALYCSDVTLIIIACFTFGNREYGADCQAHERCPPGEYTEKTGTVAEDPVCKVCEPGQFKNDISVSSTERDGCTEHSKCLAGQWTKAVGTATTDTQCSNCTAGTFRETAPADKTTMENSSKCEAHTICLAGEWTQAEGTATADTLCEMRANTTSATGTNKRVCAAEYDECGNDNPDCCVGTRCMRQNEYYSQCLRLSNTATPGKRANDFFVA